MANITRTIAAVADAAGFAAGSDGYDVRRVLVERRRELLNDIQNTLRDVRADATGAHRQVTDPGEAFEADPEDDLAFALIQMKAQALDRISEAVRRIDDGTYGYCVDCADAIAPSRLRALPFAVRCKDCAETREQSDHQQHIHARSVQVRLERRLNRPASGPSSRPF